jgi:RNA polymerase sigma factor (TIGR02999 family)
VETDFEIVLKRANDGVAAADELFTLLYDELHRLAEHTLRRDGGALTLGTTTLLHEAYLKVAGRADLAFEDRARFFSYAARAMRTLIIDYARSRRTLKRGGQLVVTLDANESEAAGAFIASEDLTRIADVLGELSVIDPSLAELVDLHFFGGLHLEEIAQLRGVSERTVQRSWRKARMLLREMLEPSDGS